MQGNVFLDSNILIDFATKRRDVRDLQRLFVLLRLGEFQAFVSSSQMTDVYYILTQGSYKIDNSAVVDFLKEILSVVEVFPLSKKEILKALNSRAKDFEDRCVFECAKCVEAEFILTSNIKDFKDFDTECGDAADFFSWVKTEKNLSYSFIEL